LAGAPTLAFGLLILKTFLASQSSARNMFYLLEREFWKAVCKIRSFKTR